jgi:hypothetical protein
LKEYEQHIKRLEEAYEERLHSASLERDHVASERDQLIIALRERNEEMSKIKEES